MCLPKSQTDQNKVSCLAKSLKATKLPQTSFSDLPCEVVRDMLTYMDIPTLHNLRMSSSLMRNLINEHIMHLFNKSLEYHTRQSPNSVAAKTAMVMGICTEIYRKSGYTDTVTSCMLHMITDSEQPFIIDPVKMRMHLLAMYGHIDSYLKHTSTQKHHLMFLLTFMLLIRKFTKKSIDIEDLSNDFFQMHRINVKIIGPTLNIVWVKNKNMRVIPEDPNILLGLMSEILIADLIGKELIRFWESSTISYIYGLKTEGLRLPNLNMICTISGSSEIFALLRSCLLDDGFDIENFVWPEIWSKNMEFSFSMIMNSKEIFLLGDETNQYIEFHPFETDDEFSQDDPEQDTDEDEVNNDERDIVESYVGSNDQNNGSDAEETYYD